MKKQKAGFCHSVLLIADMIKKSFKFPLGHSTETKQNSRTLEMNSLPAPLSYVQRNKHDFKVKHH